jgi:hypothetical protein
MSVHMSWDVPLLHLPDDVASVRDIPDGYTPPPSGQQQDVLADLAWATLKPDMSDPAWVWTPRSHVVDRAQHRLPRSNGLEHAPHPRVRRRGIDLRRRMANALRCKALDCSTGDLITPPTMFPAGMPSKSSATGYWPSSLTGGPPHRAPHAPSSPADCPGTRVLTRCSDVERLSV